MDEIGALVRGRQVICCDDQTVTLPVPGWIAEQSQVLDLSLSTIIEVAHPDDRGLLTALYFDAVGDPGGYHAVRVRSRLAGDWRHYELYLVNLLDHPDVRAILGGAIDSGPAAVDDAELELARVGDHAAVDWIMARLDTVGRIIEIQGKVTEVLGEPAESVLGRPPVDFIHKDAAVDVAELWLTFVQTPGGTDASRRCIVHADGTEVWAQVVYLNRMHDPDHGDVLMFAYDITLQYHQEAALRQSHDELAQRNREIERLAEETRSLADQFRLLADEVPAAVFRCDAAGRVTFCNARWSELVEHDGPVTDLLAAVAVPDRGAVAAALDHVANVSDIDRCTVEVRAADGQRTFSVTLRSFGDAGASARAIVGSIEDVTRTVRWREQASVDRLTGLRNRHAVETAVQRALDRSPTDVVVLFVDLDGFKAVNDGCGHDAGDQVLRAVAARLSDALRPTDLLARFGGDEFLVLCDGLDEGDVAAVVERLGHALDAPVPVSGRRWPVSASIGAARGEPGDDVASLVHRADLAMFEVKRRRKGVGPAAAPAASR